MQILSSGLNSFQIYNLLYKLHFSQALVQMHTSTNVIPFSILDLWGLKQIMKDIEVKLEYLKGLLNNTTPNKNLRCACISWVNQSYHLDLRKCYCRYYCADFNMSPYKEGSGNFWQIIKISVFNSVEKGKRRLKNVTIFEYQTRSTDDFFLSCFTGRENLTLHWHV